MTTKSKNTFKISRIIWSAKLYVKDEIKLQKNPKEKEKYQNKPLPEELKLISDLLN